MEGKPGIEHKEKKIRVIGGVGNKVLWPTVMGKAHANIMLLQHVTLAIPPACVAQVGFRVCVGFALMVKRREHLFIFFHHWITILGKAYFYNWSTKIPAN